MNQKYSLVNPEIEAENKAAQEALGQQRDDLAWQEIAQRAAYAGQDKSQDIANQFIAKRKEAETDILGGLKEKRQARQQALSEQMEADKYLQGQEANKQARLDRIQRENQARQDRLDDREWKSKEKAFDLAFKAQEKAKENEEKNKKSVQEVENRRITIDQNLALLDKLVKEKGTQEWVGDAEGDMKRLINEIATDSAKLADPESVARPSEVEQAKEGLFEPGSFTGLNSTARSLIQKYRDSVNRRAETAYKVRGLSQPQPQQQVQASAPQQKAISVDPQEESQATTWAIANANSKDPVTKSKALEILRVNGKLDSKVGVNNGL